MHDGIEGWVKYVDVNKNLQRDKTIMVEDHIQKSKEVKRGSFL